MATITVTPGHTYGTTDTVTSTNLNDLGSPTAALTAGTILTADIADANVTTAKIADANVTTAKIADSNVTFAKLTDVIDDDTMATATATTLATSESIKAYVDASSTAGFAPPSYAGGESVTLPNGLTMKFGQVVTDVNGTYTINFAEDFDNAVIYASATANTTTSETISVQIVGTPTVGSIKVGIFDEQYLTGFYWQAIGY